MHLWINPSEKTAGGDSAHKTGVSRNMKWVRSKKKVKPREEGKVEMTKSRFSGRKKKGRALLTGDGVKAIEMDGWTL